MEACSARVFLAVPQYAAAIGPEAVAFIRQDARAAFDRSKPIDNLDSP